MAEQGNALDMVQALCTITAHRDHVRLGLLEVTQDLERRSFAHDLSKLSADEFPGFARINRIARENAYGSDEYRASMRQEADTIELHYTRNSHHPEHHKLPHRGCASETMDFLDLIEMVCDWHAAYLAYGSQGSWNENMIRQEQRYGDTFSEGQWWLIHQVADWLFARHQNRS